MIEWLEIALIAAIAMLLMALTLMWADEMDKRPRPKCKMHTWTKLPPYPPTCKVCGWTAAACYDNSSDYETPQAP